MNSIFKSIDRSLVILPCVFLVTVMAYTKAEAALPSSPIFAKQSGRADASITEEAVLLTLKNLWGTEGQLPEHFSIKAAPFEIVDQTEPGRAKIRIRAQILCQDDSFALAKEVYNPFGKVFSVVRKIYARGQIVEIPLIVDAVESGSGRLFSQANSGKSKEDWGRPLSQFRNGLDIATEPGAKVAAAPEEIAQGERWLREQRARKSSFDSVMKALNEKRRIARPLSAEASNLAQLYPDIEEQILSIRRTVDRKKQDDDSRRLQAEMEPVIRADYAKFMVSYNEVLRKVNAAKKLLNES